MDPQVSANQLAFADRRHVDIADLRAASAELINLYAQFELSQQWETEESAAADSIGPSTVNLILTEPASGKYRSLWVVKLVCECTHIR